MDIDSHLILNTDQDQAPALKAGPGASLRTPTPTAWNGPDRVHIRSIAYYTAGNTSEQALERTQWPQERRTARVRVQPRPDEIGYT